MGREGRRGTPGAVSTPGEALAGPLDGIPQEGMGGWVGGGVKLFPRDQMRHLAVPRFPPRLLQHPAPPHCNHDGHQVVERGGLVYEGVGRGVDLVHPHSSLLTRHHGYQSAAVPVSKNPLEMASKYLVKKKNV